MGVLNENKIKEYDITTKNKIVAKLKPHKIKWVAKLKEHKKYLWRYFEKC